MSVDISKLKAMYQEDGNVVIAVDGVNYNQVIMPKGRQWKRYVQPFLDAGGVIEKYQPPKEGWKDRRMKEMASGGYGTIREQLELLYDSIEGSGGVTLDDKILEGIGVYFNHIKQVKVNIPKE
mgnify:CR=1 FL=1|jgi:hypothetical protein